MKIWQEKSWYDECDILMIKTQLILVAAPLLVLICAPLTYADASYDVGYNAAKFDFLYHKSYNDSCHTQARNTLNGWLGNR